MKVCEQSALRGGNNSNPANKSPGLLTGGVKAQRITASTVLVRHEVLAKLCDFGVAFCGPAPPTDPPSTSQRPAAAAHSSSAATHDTKPIGMSAKAAHGSAYYCAPEIAQQLGLGQPPSRRAGAPATELRHRAYGYDPFPTDVWSLGMMLFTLCTGLKPFHSACVSDAMFRAFILATQPQAQQHELCAPDSPLWGTPPNRPWRWPRRMSPQLVALVGACLRVEPSERISMHDVCGHAWFTSAYHPDTAAASSEAHPPCVLPNITGAVEDGNHHSTSTVAAARQSGPLAHGFGAAQPASVDADAPAAQQSLLGHVTALVYGNAAAETATVDTGAAEPASPGCIPDSATGPPGGDEVVSHLLSPHEPASNAVPVVVMPVSTQQTWVTTLPRVG